MSFQSAKNHFYLHFRARQVGWSVWTYLQFPGVSSPKPVSCLPNLFQLMLEVHSISMLIIQVVYKFIIFCYSVIVIPGFEKKKHFYFFRLLNFSYLDAEYLYTRPLPWPRHQPLFFFSYRDSFALKNFLSLSTTAPRTLRLWCLLSPSWTVSPPQTVAWVGIPVSGNVPMFPREIFQSFGNLSDGECSQKSKLTTFLAGKRKSGEHSLSSPAWNCKPCLPYFHIQN